MEDHGTGPDWDGHQHLVDELHEKVSKPLCRKRGSAEDVLPIAERILDEATDPEVRGSMMLEVSTVLHIAGDVETSWAWCRRAVAETPNDPSALNSLAAWFYYSPLERPTGKALGEALDYNLRALEKARERKIWRRLVLHDRCRIATDAKRWDIVEASLREILEVWRNRQESDLDIPMFEWDWLPRMPAGSVDEALLADYQSVVERVLEYRRMRDEQGRGTEPGD